MKNYFSKIGLLFAAALALVAFPVAAQQHQSRSFLNVQAAYVTNLLAITNLSTAGSLRTNVAGTAYSNQNARLTVSTTATLATRLNLLRDVPLWTRAGGNPAWSAGSTNAAILYNQSDATLSVTVTNGSGANSAVSFLFTPVYNGANEATATTEEWTPAFTMTASSVQTLVTNVPLWRWPGASKLRCRRITTADADADGHTIILDLSLNGYPP